MNIIRTLKNSPIFQQKAKDPLDFKITFAVCTNRGMDAQAVKKFITAGNCVKPKITLRMKIDDSLIDRARSVVASEFLRSDSDVLMFIDDDIVYDPMDVIKLGMRVKCQDYDIIGGAYLTKTTRSPFFVFRELGSKKPITFIKQVHNPETDPVEVENISTGFMAMSRRAVQAVADQVPECHKDDPSIQPFWPMFQPFPEETANGWVYKSEDWAFCTRARNAGMKVWIDPSIKLGHIGRYTYSWEDFELSKMREQLGSVDSLIYNNLPSGCEPGGGTTHGANNNKEVKNNG